MDMHADNKSEFARLRELAGLTIEEAARVTKSSLRSAYRHESGESSPSPLALEKLEMLAESHRKPERPA
jgi:DNA (cytosine-5)-methyltransferase 1